MTKYCDPFVSGPRLAMTRSLTSASLQGLQLLKDDSPLLVDLRSRTLQTLVLEHPAVDARSASTVPFRVVTALDHEPVDDAVNRAALVALQPIGALMTDAESTEAAVSLASA